MAKKVIVEIEVPEQIDAEKFEDRLKEAALLLLWLSLPPAPPRTIEELSAEAKQRAARKLQEREG